MLMCGSIAGEMVQNDVGKLLELAIGEFEKALEKSNKNYTLHCSLHEIPEFENLLAIDTDSVGDDGKPYLKVINNLMQDAFAVSLDTIVQHCKDGAFNSLVRALQTGVFNRVHGITRIVGYYSRVSNWNSSKLSELRDRRSGNYWGKMRENSEQLIGIGEK